MSLGREAPLPPPQPQALVEVLVVAPHDPVQPPPPTTMTVGASTTTLPAPPQVREGAQPPPFHPPPRPHALQPLQLELFEHELLDLVRGSTSTPRLPQEGLFTVVSPLPASTRGELPTPPVAIVAVDKTDGSDRDASARSRAATASVVSATANEGTRRTTSVRARRMLPPGREGPERTVH
jgi:hypothetical protein